MLLNNKHIYIYVYLMGDYLSWIICEFVMKMTY